MQIPPLPPIPCYKYSLANVKAISLRLISAKYQVADVQEHVQIVLLIPPLCVQRPYMTVFLDMILHTMYMLAVYCTCYYVSNNL
jgi:hypothetical protein